MPELPEVETVRSGLEKWVLGWKISKVDVLHLRAVGGPELAQLADWIVLSPVHAQVNDRPQQVADHRQRRRMHSAGFASRRLPGYHLNLAPGHTAKILGLCLGLLPASVLSLLIAVWSVRRS